jgi:hypothetical protein
MRVYWRAHAPRSWEIFQVAAK